MCIIVVKPEGVEMPSWKTLKTCFMTNPDGAGFMYSNGKRVFIRKGFMEFEEFVEAFEREMFGADTTETPIVMHFRIATHGKVQQSCCHPFPLSSDKEHLKATSTEARIGVAHNGVIQGRVTSNEWSDTMDFISGVMVPLMRMNPAFMHNSNAIELLESACGSKLAILDNAGDIVTVGHFIEDNGVLYSNETYMTWTRNYSTYGNFWEGGGHWDEYGNIGWYDDYEISDLVDMLPFYACKDCIGNEECALSCPYCTTEAEAEETSEGMRYHYEMEKERQIALL